MAIEWRNLAWRPIPFALAAGFLLRDRGVPVDPQAAHRSAALAQALSTRGLKAQPAGVTWLTEGSRRGLLGRHVRAVVKASERDDLPVLWVVDTRLSPEGVLLEASTPRRLTRSKGVEESSPAVHGQRVATALLAEGTVLSVQLVDLAGEPRPEGAAWTPLARVQNALSNLQETGQLSGVGHRAFQLEPAAASIGLRFEGDSLVVSSAGHEARVPEVLPPGARDADDPWLKPQPTEKGQVGNLVTWAVDRVRALPWFGDDNMQRLKAAAFGALDVATQARSKVTSDSTEQDIERDLGDVAGSGTVNAFTDPETGWPPPRLEPFLKKTLPGEGEWILLDHDPFIRVSPGAPPAFATTFVRTDRERAYTRIYITVWDARQVELHPVAGTVEPVSATGTAGTGVIPRRPEVMRRVVGAFNGGFQAMHGEFGMMADGVVYLPPKPFGATIAELRDGSTGFGVWPNASEIPANIVGFRQNLTPLVQDMKANPYGRTWWGGTPPGATDRVHTARSGLCLTIEGFVAYFYGNGIDAEVLGQAMIQARCKVGLHLDMNAGHTGLEFYKLAPKEGWAPLGRAYQGDWETEGDVSNSDGWRFRARRMTRGMGLMNFPRYIQRESRDFFYLTLKPVLPGADVEPVIAPAEAGEGKWRVKGLAQHGFPYALATTSLRPEAARPGLRVRVLKVDPRTVRVGAQNDARPEGKEAPPTVLLLQGVSAPRQGEPTLWLGPGGFSIHNTPVAGATPLLSGLAAGAAAAAALGVNDEDGMLIYAEVESGAGDGDAAALDRLLKGFGCSTRLSLERSLSPLQGGTTSLAGGEGRRLSGAHVKLVRTQAPGGRHIFEDTPIVPMSEWGPLQLKRIRYFRHAE
jgi:hypothetical protein